MEIKNIIFDLGGVLLNIDYNKTIAAFEQLGIPNFESLYTQAKQTKVFDHYETGKIDSTRFVNQLKTMLPHSISKKEIITAWNAMLEDLPSERLEFLSAVNKAYNTALLSNTNPLHLEVFHEHLRLVHGQKSLQPYFDGVYFSSDIGLRKPNAEAFIYVCNQHDYEPAQTLFIDDSLQHVEGARHAGLQSIYLATEQTNVIDLLRPLLTKLN